MEDAKVKLLFTSDEYIDMTWPTGIVSNESIIAHEECDLKIKSVEKVKLLFTSDEQFNTSWPEGVMVVPNAYEGPYDVIPTVAGLMLYTKNKTMADNVTVEEIPFQEVENISGGYTATIG